MAVTAIKYSYFVYYDTLFHMKLHRAYHINTEFEVYTFEFYSTFS